MTQEEYIQQEKIRIDSKRNDIKRCPYCDHSIADGIDSITSGMIGDLRSVYNWLGEQRRHVFKISEVSRLLTNSSYANFSNLREIGGLLYPPSDKEKPSIQIRRAADGTG